MRKMIFALMIVSLFLLAACGKTDVPGAPTAPSAPVAEPAAPPVKIDIAKEAIKETGCLGSENVDKLKKSMESPVEIVKMAMAVNSYLDVKVGQCVIFPVAVRNEFLDNKEFSIEVYFKRATDRAPIANVITADTETMNTWVAIPGTKTIVPHDYTIFPVKITVGDMISAEDKTAAGTYRFGLQAYYRSGDVSKTKYEPEKEVFVRILE